MDSRIWDHDDDSTTFLMGQRTELIDDWLDLTVLEAEKRGPPLKNRLVGEQKCTKDF